MEYIVTNLFYLQIKDFTYFNHNRSINLYSLATVKCHCQTPTAYLFVSESENEK
jgi:hypothetical protein